MQRIPQLDGLRGVAIGLVLLHHFIYQFHAPMAEPLATIVLSIANLGWSGVDLFFVLSGFLIGGILADARESDMYYSTFYIRRAFRILPLYLFLIFVGFLFIKIGGNHVGTKEVVPLHTAPWIYYMTFTQNFYFARHADAIWFLQVTWSLAVEEQFYLILPLLVRRVNRDKLLAVVVGLVVFFGLLRSVLYWHGDINTMQCYVLPFCRFDSLFIGVACALLLRDHIWVSWLQNHPRLLQAATALFGCSFFLMDHYLWGRNLLLHTAGFTVVGIFYACLMLSVLTQPHTLISRALSLGPLIRLGIVSYCIYLIHGPVLIIVEQIVKPKLGLSVTEVWVVIGLSVAATLLLAQGSWAIFESHLVALGHKFTYARRNMFKPVKNAA